MKKEKSFTVIELLVVIAVIGVLASIVLVSLSGTRDRANIAKTLLYSSQIYHALGADIVGNWNFDEGTGTRANDFSGYYNTGTISGSGATYTTETPQKAAGQGSGKYALSFDGVNGNILIASSASLNTVTQNHIFTFEAWVKKGSLTGMRDIIGPVDYAPRFGYCFIINNLCPSFRFQKADGTWIEHTSTFSLTPDAWYHLVMTYDKAYVKFYVNGELKNTFSETGLTDCVGSRWGIAYVGWSHFDGLIDEVRIYSRALTATEIQQHYAQGLKDHANNLAVK
jgi:prepilin-type N-terminal cleavage/methylation domain-containing protein